MWCYDMATTRNWSSDRHFWRLSRREKTVALVFLAFGLLGAWLPERLTVATSGSLEHRLFFLRPYPGSTKVGDYLVFRHRELSQVRQGLRQGGQQMVKKVGCVPGEQLVRDAEGNFTCEGRELGNALAADSTGLPLPQFTFAGEVPPGKLFMIGSHPRSYDSRYFGFIDASEILHQALPLW